MSRTLWCLVSLGLVFGLGRVATAQSFDLTLTGAAPQVDDDPDTAVTLDLTGQLVTNGIDAGDPGAQGWSIGVTSTGCDITAVTTAGTAGAPVAEGGLQNGGFEKTELTVDAAATNPAAGCPDDKEGAVSAVVLSFTMPITLEPGESPHDILKVTVEGVTPSERETCNECRVFFEDNCVGSGQPVQNVITFGGATVPPTFGESVTQLCAEAEPVGPCHTKDDVVFIVGETSAQASSDEKAGTIAEDVPLVVDVGGDPGATVQTEVYAALVSKGLPTGAQGWSLSFVAEGDVVIAGVTTAGTVGAPVPDGLQNGGFEKTERTVDGTSPNAGCPSGNEGAVSAVVLSFTMPITLNTDGTGTVLGFTVENAVPIPEDGSVGGVVTCEDDCVGSGQPVQNVATVGGSTNVLCNCQEIQVNFSPQTTPDLLSDYIRCDANNDTRNDIADGIWIVNELFRGGPVTECPAAADCSGDGLTDLSDAAYAIAYQFQGGPPPSAPFPNCGTAAGDPTDDPDFCPKGSTQCP